jgi:hypothetical protein
VQRLVGHNGGQSLTVVLTYFEQSCFAYNQGGSRRTGSALGRRKKEVAPKYIKIPQVQNECLFPHPHCLPFSLSLSEIAVWF